VPGAVSPLHLNPATELADRVLLPGDPHRALAVAQAVLEAPKMFNHRRGLWGYTGTAPDGGLLSVQSTGMGGPSAAIVVEELVALGARSLVRIGTCGALDPSVALGDMLVATEVLSEDGASRALGAPERVLPDPGLTAALTEAGARPTTVVTSDLFYEERAGLQERWRAAGAGAVEMEAATVLRVAELRGARAACVLAVTDVLEDGGGRRRIGDDALERAGVRLGEIGVAALAAGRAPSTR
jgi:DeoD family purine-nucleoside phosphorylase